MGRAFLTSPPYEGGVKGGRGPGVVSSPNLIRHPFVRRSRWKSTANALDSAS
jgi:hypothetical protein